VQIDPNLLRNRQRVSLVGNPAKLTRLTGWRPAVSFRELVKLMVQAEQEKR
jgi:GDP-D-mannose dehydratase